MTEDFLGTRQYSYSSSFSLSDNFVKSKEFSETSLFVLTSDFTRKIQFYRTLIFDESNKFSNSEQFKETGRFSLTNDYIKTNEFSFTTKFVGSNEFSVSTKFAESNGFSTSNKYSKSWLFFQSSLFSDFVYSIYFSKSSMFQESTKFSYTDQFSFTLDSLLSSAIFDESKSFSNLVNFSLSSQLPARPIDSSIIDVDKLSKDSSNVNNVFVPFHSSFTDEMKFIAYSSVNNNIIHISLNSDELKGSGESFTKVEEAKITFSEIGQDSKSSNIVSENPAISLSNIFNENNKDYTSSISNIVLTNSQYQSSGFYDQTRHENQKISDLKETSELHQPILSIPNDEMLLHEPRQLNNGQIAGIVIGVIIIVAILVFILVIFVIRKESQHSSSSTSLQFADELENNDEIDSTLNMTIANAVSLDGSTIFTDDAMNLEDTENDDYEFEYEYFEEMLFLQM